MHVDIFMRTGSPCILVFPEALPQHKLQPGAASHLIEMQSGTPVAKLSLEGALASLILATSQNR
ncbi:hypothetical protein AGR1B_pAt30158 [Agrobacterium fabacearum S56]|nr:hypothetical protein AGR1B_pAt30158 [Agrobacterium fabacearum S56]